MLLKESWKAAKTAVTRKKFTSKEIRELIQEQSVIRFRMLNGSATLEQRTRLLTVERMLRAANERH